MDDLQLAKDAEAEIFKGLRRQREERLQEELKLRMLGEVASELGLIPSSNIPF